MSSVTETTLYRFIQAINLLSLSLVLTPYTLKNFLGIHVIYSTKYDYFYSLSQFVPRPIQKLFYPDPIAVQTISINDTKSLFFPGVAMECFIGTMQGLIVGTDLWRRGRKGRMRTPRIHAVCFYGYTVMCISAFPLHCLKDYSLFDISSKSSLTQTLFWLDTFGTSLSPPLMFLAGLIENRSDLVPESQRDRWVWSIVIMNAILTYLGIAYDWPWITMYLHIASQTVFCFPLLFLTWKAVQKYHCRHGFYTYMVLAKVCSFVFAYNGMLFLAALLSRISGGAFCPLTSAFVGCRIGMMQYWVYCRKESECVCFSTSKVEKKTA